MERQLRFTEDGRFRILQLTDLHFMDGSEADDRTEALMRQLITKSNPELIVLTGDTVYGEQNEQLVKRVISVLDEFQIPWTICFGNHDSEDPKGLEREALFEAFVSQSKYCIAGEDAPHTFGVGDHRIDLYDAAGKERLWALYILDSGDYMPEDPRYYDYIKADQIQWLRENHKELDEGVQALCFFHIPLPEYRTLMQRGEYEGQALEDVCCPPMNSGLFSTLVEGKRFRGVFVGHDHINNFHGELLGIALVYGQASGYNTYSEEGFLHGGRIIDLDVAHPDSFETWILDEEGHASEPVRLGNGDRKWLDVEDE